MVKRIPSPLHSTDLYILAVYRLIHHSPQTPGQTPSPNHGGLYRFARFPVTLRVSFLPELGSAQVGGGTARGEAAGFEIDEKSQGAEVRAELHGDGVLRRVHGVRRVRGTGSDLVLAVQRVVERTLERQIFAHH